MTLEESVDVLNRENHRNVRWFVGGVGKDGIPAALSMCHDKMWGGAPFLAFEAIAIAEKLERERPNTILTKPGD